MRLVDVDNLKTTLKKIINPFYYGELEIYIDQTPTVDPVKHGKWIETNEDGFENVYCSVCGCSTYRDECFGDYIRFAYCSSCGAKNGW